MAREWLIDDFARPQGACGTGTAWRCFTDRVMGGVSEAAAQHGEVAGRPALRLRGQVSLENNGGFVQLALDLAAGGAAVDAGAYAGLALDLYGDGRSYNLHLRTDACLRPWQSYRATVATAPAWRSLCLPFSAFAPHRLEAPLDTRRLRRVGLVAIGEAGPVDVAIGRLALYA